MNRIIFSSICLFLLSLSLFAQQRPRVVQTNENTEVTEKPIVEKPKSFPQLPNTSRPVLDKQIIVIGESASKKIEKEKPVFQNSENNSGNLFSESINQRLRQAIQQRVGIPYRYGSTGPNSYDCSGLVWSVFQDAGIDFERSSAGTYWQRFESVNGNEKYKFGTLVFFNRLGHVGIVADENGFYHASSSKGVTYSPFAGYWGKRIVGFRKIPQFAN
jgi:cell wall-associated NlpC family hydrolase